MPYDAGGLLGGHRRSSGDYEYDKVCEVADLILFFSVRSSSDFCFVCLSKNNWIAMALALTS
jgi:hypothetical protein